MPYSAHLIEEIEKLDPQLRAIFIDLLKEIEKEREETITRREFLEFSKRTEENFQKVWKAIEKLTEAQIKLEERVAELVEAQKRTDSRINRLFEAQMKLEEKVAELVEAQKRTDSRINQLFEAQMKLEKRVAELVEAQKRTDSRINQLFEAQMKLEKRVAELVEAQKRTDSRINRLFEAQIKLEEKVSSLAEAQNRTEEELRQLVIDHRETRRQLGGLSQTIGYTLENEAYKALPILLERDYKITLKEKLKRGYITTPSGEDIEINILGKGKLNGREITIIGECKSQLSKNDVDNFIRKKLEKVKQVIKGEIFPLIVTHMISQKDVEDYTREKRITLYYSYDFV